MRYLAVLLCLIPSLVSAQIVMPDTIEPYKKIVAGCDCIVPKDGLVQIRWRVNAPAESAVKPATGTERVDKLHIWAPPGTHYVQAIVIVTSMQEIRAEVTDSEGNKSIQTIKVPSGFEFFDYDKTFTVGKPGPGPGPGPDPPPPGPDPPGPGPTPPADKFAAEVYKLIQEVKKTINYMPDKFNQLAGAYDSVAAQAVATQANYDATAFTSLTKDKYNKIFTIDEVQKLGPVFTTPLSKVQASIFNERGGNPSDEAALAVLWRDTATAIRAATSATEYR